MFVPGGGLDSMKDTLRVVALVALLTLVLAPGAALAGNGIVLVSVVPELDPSLTITGLALLGGAAAFVIERYRRRAK
jgi:membrane protein implicated in regulation of membrane protease activity